MDNNIESLIRIVSHKQRLPNTNMKWDILSPPYNLTYSKDNRTFFDFIYFIKNNHNNINICIILDELECITTFMDNNDAREFVNIIISENYKIESILYKIYDNNTLINIINNTDFVINYDLIFSYALRSTHFNVTIVNYIIHGDLIDFNNFNLYECISKIRDPSYYRVIDMLLTKGVDISKFPINDNNIVQILWNISLPNLKYFSNIKIMLNKYTMIILTLEYTKLEEFLKWCDPLNIVDCKISDDVQHLLDYAKRVQLLLDSGINLDKVLNLLFKAINNHCECDCLNFC